MGFQEFSGRSKVPDIGHAATNKDLVYLIALDL
jgi:hypothetical protein